MKKLNFENFVDTADLTRKIKKKSATILTKWCIASGASDLYLEDLGEYFFDNIKEISALLYENILLKKDLNKISFSIKSMRDCIEDGVSYFFTKYDEIIRTANMGNTFTNYADSSDKFTKQFNKKSKQVLDKQLDVLCSKYYERVKSQRFNFWLLTVAIIGAIGGMIAGIPIIIPFMKLL